MIPLRDSIDEFYLSEDVDIIEKKDSYYVLDKVNHQVAKYNSNGKFIRLIGKKGKGPGEYGSPTGIIDLGIDRGIAIYDRILNEIHQYDQQGD